jgi:hypothetical protein
MSHEEVAEHYRGVFCGYCRQPIPLPAIVERLTTRDSGYPARGAHVFNLRCRACQKEKPYRRNEITEFEGTPRPRFSKAGAVGLLHHEHKIARAANG